MSDREDPDDWFGGEPDERPEAATEDWLVEKAPPKRSMDMRVDRRFVVAAAVGIALLFAVLAAAGVFSSGGSSPSPPVVTPTVTTSTTPATTTPTPTTTPAPAVKVPTVDLKAGDKGSQVTLLQQALKSLGYLTGKTDGQFGAATEEAVKAFQRAKGLTADGVVGKATRAALASAVRAR